MQIIDTIPLRHSVRRFQDKPIHAAKAAQLQYVILDKDVVVRAGAKLHGTPQNPVIIRRGEVV